ncbi:hypothetical protein CORC01_07948 [Colletotrichum orchidophilum]|uniref:Uncharacterized protein n=1 Tax=Colletotrichum orchidophilum TaxID=1209926 RepID=A0A1G4B682_9PEZI|nr:uncharacterized protein CORC01_07948 [Colletotrichum orchidophilum]OHE96802.1 hypothetical protein CORC01_07948 [Colletotrichum orchidophilum]
MGRGLHNGTVTFHEYFAPAALTTNHQHSITLLDTPHNAATIPGDGNTPVTFIYTFDVACYIVTALDIPAAWTADHELRIVCDGFTICPTRRARGRGQRRQV